MGRIPGSIGAALLAAALAACSESGDGGSDLAEQGRRVYQNVCIACHNADPAEDGALGPAIAGASRELLEARVLHGAYPPDYTPKRQSQAMPTFPYLKDDIPALEAYLAEAADDEHSQGARSERKRRRRAQRAAGERSQILASEGGPPPS